MIVTIWICPTEGCGNYFASSGAGDLTQAWNLDQHGKRTFKRSRCPACHVRGVDVDRVAHLIPAVTAAS